MAGPCSRGDVCIWVKTGESESLQVSVDVLLVSRTEGRVPHLCRAWGSVEFKLVWYKEKELQGFPRGW